jgi:hypothetical protein
VSIIEKFGRRVRMQHSLRKFTVQVWHRIEPRIIGTGFMFRPNGQILTCAHVVRDASGEAEVAPGVEVYIRFHRDQMSPHYQQQYPDYQQCRAKVIQNFHQIYEGHYYDDVAVLELIDAPASLIDEQQMARLEPAYHPTRNFDSSSNPFRSYGYSPTGRAFISAWAEGMIEGPVECPAEISLRADPLQLSSDSIEQGMSGAALLDMRRDRVVGLITHQFYVQGREPGRGKAFGADAKIVLF